MTFVQVYLKEKQKRVLEAFAKENELSVSGAARMLMFAQMRYLKSGRRKGQAKTPAERKPREQPEDTQEFAELLHGGSS